MSITKDEMRELLKEQAKLIGGSIPAGSKTSTEPSKATKEFEDNLNKAGDTLKSSWTGKIGAAGEAYDKLKNVINENMGMWKDLSKSGMNFSGDLVGMTIAAKGMRLETSEMTEMLLKNSEGLVGFGGNLTRSAEGFAKASKHFFDQNTDTADGLRRLGLTSKDINEVMMLQGSMTRGQFRDEKERLQVMAESTGKLASEMDLMAKLTGKSREQQMEQMKKQQADMQFDAIIREKAKQIEDPKERKAFIDQANLELKKYELEGRGQLYKELVAFGAPVSQATAQQTVFQQEQVAAMKRSGDAINNAQLTSIERQAKLEKTREDVYQADVKMANDTNFNRLRIMGGLTAIGESTLKQSGAINTQVKNLETFAAQYNENEKNKVKLDLNNEADRRKAIQLMVADAEKSSKGLNSQGEQVDGTTKALTQLEGRLGDISSAMYSSLVTPLNKEVNPALGKLADSALAARGNLIGGIMGPNTQKETVPVALEKEFTKGRTTDRPQNVAQTAGAITNLGERGINWLNNDAPDLLKKVGEKVDQVTGRVPKKEYGSLGTTGQMWENFGQGQLVELHGIESVMRPQDLAAITKNQMEGMLKAIPKTGMMGDLDAQKKAAIQAGAPKTGNINLSNIDKNIKTEFSSILDANKVDLKSLKFDQYGMPITKDIKTKAAEMAQEVQKKEEKKAETTSNVEDMKKGIAAGKPAVAEEKKAEPTKPVVPAGKETSLNDVVVALNQVNTKLGTLIDVQRDIGQKQIKATKANSSDVYAR